MTAQKLGVRIKTFRERQGMTRDELAKRADLDAAFIAALEDEDVSPSLGPLIKISRALGVRLGTFMDDELTGDLSVVRAREREEETAMRKARGKDAALKFHPLGQGKTDRHMEPFFIAVMPEAREEEKLSSHEGEEFIVVVSGELEFVLGKERHVLGPGDSVYFNSVVPHYVGCHGKVKAEIYAVLYFPE